MLLLLLLRFDCSLLLSLLLLVVVGGENLLLLLLTVMDKWMDGCTDGGCAIFLVFGDAFVTAGLRPFFPPLSRSVSQQVQDHAAIRTIVRHVTARQTVKKSGGRRNKTPKEESNTGVNQCCIAKKRSTLVDVRILQIYV